MSSGGGVTSSMAAGRIMRELKELQKNPIEGIQVEPRGSSSDVPSVWTCSIVGAPGSIYEGEVFEMKVE